MRLALNMVKSRDKIILLGDFIGKIGMVETPEVTD